MRAVIQRVAESSVTIDNKVHAKIGHGLLILIGICHEDNMQDIIWLTKKIVQMRIFGDAEGKMNKNLTEVEGSMLVISQFTLHASTKKGNRPSFIKAARPQHAIPLYESLIDALKETGNEVKSGIFGADMKVSLINDGPVTIILDSHQKE